MCAVIVRLVAVLLLATSPAWAEESSAKKSPGTSPPASPGKDNKPAQADKPPSDRAALEKKFQQAMNNVTLVGHFTDSKLTSDKLTEEKYVIEKVEKDQGDDWYFTVRIQYRSHNVPVRLKIPVKWAGDTPILSVTDLSIPLLGTFHARVVVYDGQYAGTWSGAGHGGHLFGKIVHNEPAETKESSPDKSAPSKSGERDGERKGERRGDKKSP
jgi:hypothetical protein